MKVLIVGKKIRRRLTAVLVAAVFATVCSLYFARVARPLVQNLAEAKVKALAANAVNDAGMRLKLAGLQGSYYSYIYDAKGDVALVVANSLLINQTHFAVQGEMLKAVEALENKHVDVPLGAFLGMLALSASGPPVRVPFMPIGSAECKLKSRFESAGINQTKHIVLIEVSVEVILVLPLKRTVYTHVQEVLLAETIIVGKVPDLYVLGGAGGRFDLVP